MAMMMTILMVAAVMAPAILVAKWPQQATMATKTKSLRCTIAHYNDSALQGWQHSTMTTTAMMMATAMMLTTAILMAAATSMAAAKAAIDDGHCNHQ